MNARNVKLYPVSCRQCRRVIEGLLAQESSSVICPGCAVMIKVESPERVITDSPGLKGPEAKAVMPAGRVSKLPL